MKELGYTLECAYHAQCVFRLRSQYLAANDRIRATDGDAIDLIVNRHFLSSAMESSIHSACTWSRGLRTLAEESDSTEKQHQHKPGRVAGSCVSATYYLPSSSHSGSLTGMWKGLLLRLHSSSTNRTSSSLILWVCVWELNNGRNQFEMHPQQGFDTETIRQDFRVKHQLIQDCSDLHCVKFTRASWNFKPGSWRIGSMFPLPVNKALVACVVLSPGICFSQGCCTSMQYQNKLAFEMSYM